MGRVAFLVTSNIHKFHETRQILSEHKIATAMLKRVDAIEIQDENIENIAKASAVYAVEKCNLPVIVEDAGLHIYALKGFPGVYSSYVYRTIGNEGILKLLDNVDNRKAYFQSVVAFLSPTTTKPMCFSGRVEGHIVKEMHGNRGFGFDPIFKPSNSLKTFAQMSLVRKNQYSHRALALHKFAKWYTTCF